jgi:hypothetical protein
MGGGLMQLVAYGAQDIYLTGNPQITFFKVVYRRHTNFSTETIEQSVNGAKITDGGSGTVTVSRNGDLVYKVYITSSTAGISNGDEIIDDVEIEIGGQRIDRQFKEWNQIWAELSIPETKAMAYKNMTSTLSHGLGNTISTPTVANGSIGMAQIPLNFWFCRNPGLALPLIALQYHDVKIKITWGVEADVGVQAACKVWCDYIYLDTDERRRFAQTAHEYLIEQIQKQSAGASDNQKLNFNHPCKEIIWTSSILNSYGEALLKLNGHERFAAQEEEYFQLRQPMDYHTAVPGTNYSMSENILMIQPRCIAMDDVFTATGTATTTLHTTVSASSNGLTTLTLLVGTDFIASSSASNYPLIGDIIRIERRDESEIATGARHFDFLSQVTSVASQTNGFNLGLTITDPKAAIGTKLLVATTDDDNVSIYIVGRLQNNSSRCSSLSKKINIYSFAITPEEHQPSGTCNFSRIDNAKLITTNALTTDDNIYVINYNVLRIISGMGGLAYSN